MNSLMESRACMVVDWGICDFPQCNCPPIQPNTRWNAPSTRNTPVTAQPRKLKETIMSTDNTSNFVSSNAIPNGYPIIIDGGSGSEHHHVVLAAINLCNTLRQSVRVRFLVNSMTGVTGLGGPQLELWYEINYLSNAARITSSYIAKVGSLR